MRCWRRPFGQVALYLVAALLAGRSAVPVHGAGGDVDLAFDPGTGFERSSSTAFAYATALQTDGRIVVVGAFTSYDGIARNGVARLNTNGSLDGTFDPGTGLALGEARSVALQPDGKFLIAGPFSTYNGVSRVSYARINADGTLDTSFDPHAEPNTADGGLIVLQPDGKVIVTGDFTAFSGVARANIARLNADGSLDANFDPGAGPQLPFASDPVTAVAVQPDGQILIGGAFNSYDHTPRNHLARLNVNGSLDTTFDPGAGADNYVSGLAVQPDGKLIIIGGFTHYQGSARPGVARLNSDGSLDVSFDPLGGITGGVPMACRLQADGKLLIAGGFTDYDGFSRVGIARLNADGSLDSTIDPGTGADPIDVRSVLVLPDGKIVLSGGFTSYHGTMRQGIVRVLPATGAISYSSDHYSVGEGDGNATMTLTRTGGTDNRIVARITLTDISSSPADYIFGGGALDTSFDAGGVSGNSSNIVYSIAVQPDRKIIVGGYYFNYGGENRNGIARLNSDGSLDLSFDPGLGTAFDPNTGGTASVLATLVQPDGKVVIGGAFNLYDGITRNYIARVNSDGSLDQTFDAGDTAIQPVRTLSLQPDGKVILGGDYITQNGLRTFVARLNPDGSPDGSFHPANTVYPSILTTALQADGKIMIGGDFISYAGTDRNFIVRLNADGSLDSSFDSTQGANGIGSSIAIQPDGKIVVGSSSAILQRLNPDGSLDPTFDFGSGPDGPVQVVVLQPDGKIVFSGNFENYNGIARRFIARVNADGSLDPDFDPGGSTDSGFTFSGIPVAVMQPDGEILIGGGFGHYKSIDRRGIARISGGNFFAVWPAGDATDKTYRLPIVDDALLEGNETLTLGVIPIIGGATLGLHPTATLTIIDNDGSFPTLTAPATGTLTNSPVSVAFSLPEAAQSGSLALTFIAGASNHALILASAQESTGPHQFTFAPANPTGSAAIASGAAIPDGTYTVTLSYRDSGGNEVAAPASTNVTIDTVAPILTPPVGGFMPVVLYVSQGGKVALPNYVAQAQSDDASATVTQAPPANSLLGEGTTLVTLTATDPAGNQGTLSLEFSVFVSGTTNLAVKGGTVPNVAGDPRIPLGTTWSTLGIPSIMANGAEAGWLATVSTGATSFSGIFAGPILAPTLRVKTGDAATDAIGNPIAGVTFKSFREPVFAGDDYAVIATVKGAPISTANNTGLWCAKGGTLRDIGHEGSVAPGTTAKFNALISVAMPAAGVVFFEAKLAAPIASDLGLWRWTEADGTQLCLRERDVPSGYVQPLASFVTLNSVKGSPGHGRHLLTPVGGGLGAVDALMIFADGTPEVIEIRADGGIDSLNSAGFNDANGNIVRGFGIPSGCAANFIGTSLARLEHDPVRGITAANDMEVLDAAAEGVVAQTGSTAPGAGTATFSSFLDPVIGSDSAGDSVIAFGAKLAGAGSGRDTGIWQCTPSVHPTALLAREGDEPPEPAGTKWKSFVSLTVVDGRGPMFLAKLASGGVSVNTGNDVGLWATDSGGTLRLLLREGQEILPGRKLRNFTVLGAVSGSPGQRRSWTSGDASARLIYRAVFIDGTSAILSTTVP